ALIRQQRAVLSKVHRAPVEDKHPDPNGEQLEVLKLALRRLMFEVKVVHPSFISETAMSASIHSPDGPTHAPNRIAFAISMALFLWCDFFSCYQNPQGQEEEGDLQSAIDNIPGYVARCTFFFVLCPVIASRAFSRLFTQDT
ncbi:unnamed protein product, partial [Symbiodinium sp. KB8]